MFFAENLWHDKLRMQSKSSFPWPARQGILTEGKQKMNQDNAKNQETPAGRPAITRRDFLNGVLLAAAAPSLAGLNRLLPTPGSEPTPRQAAAAPGSEDHSDDFAACHQIWKGELGNAAPQADPGAHLYDCLVIGGGMSGLAAAWKLARLGISDVLVLERNDQPGGLCRADTIGGVQAARASAYPSFPFNADMIDLYRDLGFIKKEGKIRIDPQFVIQPPYDRLYINKQWVSDPFSEQGISELPVSKKVRGELNALVEALDKLWEWEDAGGRSAFDCPVDSASPQMRSLDRQTLGEYVQSKGWSLEMIKIFDPLLRSAYGLGHERISAWAALDLLSDELLPADPGEDAPGFPGGNAYFAAALARWLGPKRILPGATVTRVQQQNKEALVTLVRQGKTQALRGRTAIFAAPQFLAPYLLPDLPADRRKAAQSFEYASYVVANVAVSRTPPGLAYSNQLTGGFAMSDFIVADWAALPDPAGAPLSRRSVLTAYCPLGAADRSRLLSPSLDEWQARIVSELEQCAPGTASTVTGFYLYRWGHAFAVPAREALFSAARQLAQTPLGRILFAHADVEGIPTIDHAMASGFRSARQAAQLLE